MTIEPVARTLEALSVPFALIGAHAMAARGYPRFTADVDLLTTDRCVLDPSARAALVGAGAGVDPRTGDADDPLAGVIHIQLADETDVDVIVGRWPWEAGVIARAERLAVLGTNLPVPRTSDLILLKLAAGGYLDRQDAAALLALGDRATIAREVDAHIDEVSPGILALWRELQASIPDE
jgi:hypothetical protein